MVGIETRQEFHANPTRKVDLLRALEGGLPDIRIAIISSNVGAGKTAISNICFPLGDKGRFQVKAGCGLDPSQSYFLAMQENGTKLNFTGELETVFSCMQDWAPTAAV